MLRTLRTKAGNAKQKASTRRYSYRFRLHGKEGGGIVIVDTPTLDQARDVLRRRYGDRLALVARA